jgi:hypothetical protein
MHWQGTTDSGGEGAARLRLAHCEGRALPPAWPPEHGQPCAAWWAQLEAVAARLPRVDPRAGVCTGLAGLVPLRERSILLGPGRPPALLARQGQALVLWSPSLSGGERRPAPLPPGTQVLGPSVPPFAVINQLLTARADPAPGRVLVRSAAGTLSVWDPAGQALHALPDAFATRAERSLAAMSVDGRYIGVVSINGKQAQLKVLDSVTGNLLSDVLLSAPPLQLSIAADGTALMAKEHQGYEVPPESLELAECKRSRLESGSGLYMLSPDEREVIRGGPRPDALVLAGRGGTGTGTLLAHPAPTEGVRPASVAFSPGKVLVAVAYSDNTVGVFDLSRLGAAGTPQLHYRLAGAGVVAGAYRPQAWFDAEGGTVHTLFDARPTRGQFGAPTLHRLPLA